MQCLKDAKLIGTLEELGNTYMEELKHAETTRKTDSNPQTLHRAFKTKIISEIRRYSKDLKPKIVKELGMLRKNRTKILNNTHLTEDVQCKEAALIDERIQNLEALCFARARDTVAASFYIYGETIPKPWINLNEERIPRDFIAALKCPAPL